MSEIQIGTPILNDIIRFVIEEKKDLKQGTFSCQGQRIYMLNGEDETCKSVKMLNFAFCKY